MSSITSQAKIQEGLQPINSELFPTSAGEVSKQGMHIPDLNMIDGKNIMPTLGGYTSFFGQNSKVGAGAISTDVQDIICYRTFSGNTILIAFVRDGLWIKSLAGDGTATVTDAATEVNIELENNELMGWTKVLTTVPTSPWENWTWCIIRNKLYMYQKGVGKLLRLDSIIYGEFEIAKLDPTYIIGTGQRNEITLTVEDDSAQPAGGSYKEFEYLVDGSSYGKYRSELGTAAQVSIAPERWAAKLAASGLFSVLLTETSRTETDFSYNLKLPDSYESDGNYTPVATIDGPNSRLSASMTTGAPYACAPTIYCADANIPFTGYTGNWELTVQGTTVAFTFTTETPAERLEKVLDLIGDNFSDIIIVYSVESQGTDYEFEWFFRGAWDEITFSLKHIDTATEFAGFAVLWEDPHPDATNDERDFLTEFVMSIQTLVTIFPFGTTHTYEIGAISFTVTHDGVNTYTTNVRAALVAAGITFTENASFFFIKTPATSYDYLSASFPSDVTVYAIYNYWYGVGSDDDWWTMTSPTTANYLALTGFNYGDSNNITVTITDDDDDDSIVATYAAAINVESDIESVLSTMLGTSCVNEVAAEHCKVVYNITLAIELEDNLAVPTTANDKDGTTLYTVSAITVTATTLPQVEGIFSARDRLGAWTKDGTIHWSSAVDVTDFTPSKTTQANDLSVNAVLGNIVHCLGYDNGFVIYSSGNVVIGSYTGGQFVFAFKAIEQSSGCIDPRHISGNLSAHYYWSELGLQVVQPNKHEAEVIDPSLTDWLSTYKFPITIRNINNRFLAIELQYSPDTFSYRKAREATVPSAIAEGYVTSPFNAPTLQEFDPVLYGRNLYPTYTRAIVFDILLGRWGTCDIDHKVLYSLNPVNQQGFPIEKNYFLKDASLHNELRGLAILDENGYSWLADTHTIDAYCLFGKYAVHRYRETKLVELFAEFVNVPSETEMQIERNIAEQAIYDITTDTRLDGIHNRLDQNLAGNWFNLLVRGEHFHLKRLMARGYAYGR